MYNPRRVKEYLGGRGAYLWAPTAPRWDSWSLGFRYWTFNCLDKILHIQEDCQVSCKMLHQRLSIAEKESPAMELFARREYERVLLFWVATQGSPPSSPYLSFISSSVGPLRLRASPLTAQVPSCQACQKDVAANDCQGYPSNFSLASGRSGVNASCAGVGPEIVGICETHFLSLAAPN